MKKIGFLIVAMIFATACQEQQKIGFIDTGEVINDYQEKIDIEAKYKLKDEAFTKRADSIGQAFQLEAQDFQIKSKNMSQKRAQGIYDELGKKQQLLQQQFQREQQQLQQDFATEIDSAVARVKAYVTEYGKKNGYTYILGTTEASSSVMYGEEANDLSKIILEGLNEQYKKN